MSSSLKDLQCIAVRKVDVSRASKTSTTHPQSRQAAESPILAQQQTNHAGRLVLLASAPGCPTGSATGLLQWDSLQRSLVHGFGRLPTALSDRQDRPGKATGQRTPKTNSSKKNEFRYNAAPGEVKNRGRGARTGVLWGAKRLQSLVTLASATFSFGTYTTSTDDIDKQT